MGGRSNDTRYRTEIPCLLPFIGGMPDRQEDLESSIKSENLSNPEKTIPQILQTVDETDDWKVMTSIGKDFIEDYSYRPRSGIVNWSSGDNRANQNVDIEFIDDPIAGVSVKNSIDAPNLKQLGKQKHLGFKKGEDVFGLSPHYRDLYRHTVDKLFEQGHFKSKDEPYEAEVIDTRSGEKILITSNSRRERTFTKDELKDWPGSTWRKVVGRFAKEILSGTDDVFESIARDLGKDLCPILRPNVEALIKETRQELVGCLDKPYHFYCVKGRELFLVPSKNDDRWNNLSIDINSESKRFGSGIKFRCDVSVGDSTSSTTIDIWLRSNSGLFTNCMIGVQNLKHKERLWERIN